MPSSEPTALADFVVPTVCVSGKFNIQPMSLYLPFIHKAMAFKFVSAMDMIKASFRGHIYAK
jgi:hypothetical protein